MANNENLSRLPVSVLNDYPVIEDQSRIDSYLKKLIDIDTHKLVVLDDDPTGVQTVHDVHVYTNWDIDSIREGFQEDNKLFYILTNSRGMTVEETTRAHKEIAANIAAVSDELNRNYMILSRSDSTMRGHFPLETRLLREGMMANGYEIDGEVMCPFFKEGGRFTIGNVHYVKQGDELVPAADTEFALDKTFGYKHSSIPEYIEEKTEGEYPAKDVICISLDDLRKAAQELSVPGEGDPVSPTLDKIVSQIVQVSNFNKICVNAIDYVDLKVFSIALYLANQQGKVFEFRTAAGLVKAMGGVSDKPLLERADMVHSDTNYGGVIVVGSHTKKTTAQLEKLLTLEGIEAVEFDSNKVLEGDEAFYAEVDRCVKEEERIIKSGKTSVCYTKRQLLSLENDTKESALLRSVKISDGVQSLVARLSITPAFVVAKGGITSSDVGTKALQVKRALVLGQIMPGIPVWQTGSRSRFPGIPYVIFPGNVGEEDTLYEAVKKLI
jgi:uncharacterized protein YgbK (DUF1537 family)